MIQVVFSITPIESKTGEFHLMVVILKDSSKNKSNKSVDVNNNDKLTYNFEPADSPVTIGRGDCKIKLSLSSLSKKHCTIVFNNIERCWEIEDGYDRRSSTNGTWLLINSKYEIEDETFVKISNNTFKIGFA